MIRVENVTQHYNVKPVLRDINLEFHPGTRTAVIGPNGMGKTTLLSVLAGVLQPQRGFVEIDGMVRRSSMEAELEIRRRCVFLPDNCWLPKNRTGREYLLSVGTLYDIESSRLIDHSVRLLRLFELTTLSDAPIRTYSAGQRKKIALCSALISEAPILLLDEPFSGGLDPAGILALKYVLERLALDENRTIVVTTPVPEIVQEIADRIIVVKNGQIVLDGTFEDLRRAAGGNGTLDDILERVIFPETMEYIEQYFEGRDLDTGNNRMLGARRMGRR
jgi:ABC-type multidrug transport system ATPase subunit